MTKPGIIALDLDGTLLTTDKRLTERNRAALELAAREGAAIVPATGRIFRGLPQVVLDAPWLRYAILSNGASVYDVREDAILYRAEIGMERALEIMRMLDGLPVIYDCYKDGRGYMTREMWEAIATYAPSPIVVDYMRSVREPVDDLKAFIERSGSGVEKIQAFCLDMELRAQLLEHPMLSGLSVTSSVRNNVEINHSDATKGGALMALARHLRVEPERVAAFGDGLNDVSMLSAAGMGVAMGNADDNVKARAKLVAPTNDEDGVAVMVEAMFA